MLWQFIKKSFSQIKNERTQFKRDNKLSIYQKALLGKHLQKELFKLDYSNEFVEEATEEIILLISCQGLFIFHLRHC